jgi:hopanoid biosynthesis associated protein HpnK
VRRLIVNADDFGFTSGVNRAIVEAHTRGIVTSSTLMANGRAFAEAVSMAQNASGLSIGCHIVLIDGEPVLPAERVSTLVTKSGRVRFRDDLKNFVARALSGRLSAEEIEAEAAAQMSKIQSTGIKVSHFDSHKHTHLFPQTLRPLLRAARNCGVHAVRNPFGPRFPLKSSQLLTRPNLWTRFAELKVLRRFATKFRQAVDAEGFATPDGTLGIEVTGTLDETLFRAIAQAVPEGTWEFVCHPGYNDDDLQNAGTRLRESREVELRVLTLSTARELLLREGIELISYRELGHA